MSELLRLPAGDKRLKKANNPIKYRLTKIRQRCKAKGIKFELKEEDIIIPSHCPLLGIKLIHYTNRGDPNSDRDRLWSVDRFDPTKGYTKDNVWVISMRANMIKNDSTIEEFERMLSNWKRALSCREGYERKQTP